MTLEYWYMFPVALAVSTLAMSSGIGGATFFSPIFILALGLRPEVAIGTALLTETFGFASGLLAYFRARVIDFKLGGIMLIATIPLALVGTYLGGVIDPNILKIVLAVALLAVGISFLHAPGDDEKEAVNKEAALRLEDTNPDACITARDGERICHVVQRRFEGLAIGAIGGLFLGLTSTGLGELNDYFLLRRCRVPSRVVFTIPGVLIGCQIGPRVAARIPERAMQIALSVLFILIGFLTVGEVIIH